MKAMKDATICVVDNNEFVAIAREIAPFFKKVYYTSSSKGESRKTNTAKVGSGYDEIELIDSAAQVDGECDAYFFFDIYFREEQKAYSRRGIPVWGAHEAETLERNRNWCKKLLKAYDLPVGKYQAIKGFDKLEEALKPLKDVFVKLSDWRGHFETTNFPCYEAAEEWLKYRRAELGALRNEIEFTIEWPLKDMVEIGTDGYNILGRHPMNTLYGFEIKNTGYIGKVEEWSKIPKCITSFSDIFAPVLNKLGMKGFKSEEIRTNNPNTGYMIDFTPRAAAPPFEAYIKAYKNLAEIMWNGAHGVLVEPEFDKKKPYWSVILVTTDKPAEQRRILYPDKYRNRIVIRDSAKIDGYDTVIPQESPSTILAGCVGNGATVEDAMSQAQEIADSIEGMDITVQKSSMEIAMEEIAKTRSYGIPVFGGLK